MNRRLHKKLLKGIAFPLLNRWLAVTGQHLYHYSPTADRLTAITTFNAATYKYIDTLQVASDHWWSTVRSIIPRGGVILDVGANVGFTAAWFAALADRVYAFEPHPVNARVLREQIRIRGLDNVEARETAVGKEAGHAELYCKPRPGLHSLVDVGETATIGTLTVPCTTLDTVFREESIGSVRLLKVDVEGFEPEVLQGARDALSSGRIDRVLFEHNPGIYRKRNLEPDLPIELLGSHGYRVYHLDGSVYRVGDGRGGSQADLLALRGDMPEPAF